ncbi:uncharacterized protein KZ484_024989 [Pholidichthys leucotaenia]
MGHQIKDVDIESLQERVRRRGSCLDVFLVASVGFLFLAVAGLAGVMFVVKLPPTSGPDRLTGVTHSLRYKMENFAYLEFTKSELDNYTMHLAPVDYGNGTSVGSTFSFFQKQHSLKPQRQGTFFMYADLHFTCSSVCSTSSIVTVSVGDNKLNCEVELPANSTSVSKKCWTVAQLEDKRMCTQMTVANAKENKWTLEVKKSGIGMFLIG